MLPPPIPADDAARLAVLHSLGILDTPPEPDFDELTAMVAQICQVPIALISLVDRDRQWFKSRVGLEADSTPRESSFCAHAIAGPNPGLFVVADTHNDPRFADNPLVTGDPHMRFYAGAPLVTSDHVALGTLCVIDREPRELTPIQLRALATLRRHVVKSIELRRLVENQNRIIVELEQARRAVDAARRVAEEATRAKAEFLAAMSHEIRTPMNAVVGMTTLLLSSPLTAEQHENLEIIRLSGEHLLTVINDVLDFSKIEAERLVLEQAPFSPADCVAAAASLLLARATEKQIALRTLIDPSVPALVSGDVTRLRQILVNLLSNAVKFTDRGEVQISVSCRAEADRACELTFAIRDTGIGIPPDRLAHIFQQFSQVDASTTRRFGGTGLGLAISRRLAELHGGRMWVESQPGVGSTFHFTVRGRVVSAPPTIEVPVAASAGPQIDAGFALRHPARILVAEDNPINQKVIVRLLAKLGYSVSAAANGNEALAALREADFDVVLMDVEMPDLDGPSATREIRRELPAERQPVVIALTAHAIAGSRELFLSAGMDAYLPKPIRLPELMALLADRGALRRH